MIAIAQEKLETARESGLNATLAFREATADTLAREGVEYVCR
jgi:hypothetical protein